MTHSIPSTLQLWHGAPDLTRSHFTLRVRQWWQACDARFFTGFSGLVPVVEDGSSNPIGNSMANTSMAMCYSKPWMSGDQRLYLNDVVDFSEVE